MQDLLKTGKVRNIGVSNFQIRHLEKLLGDPSCKVVPAVNQIELHPGNPSTKLVDFCKKKNIHVTAYSCLGGAVDNPLYRESAVVEAAEATGKSPAQVLYVAVWNQECGMLTRCRLMWGLRRDTSVIPKSVTPSRIDANFDLDGWTLTDQQMQALDSMKTRFKVVNDSWMPIKVFFGDDE